MSKRNATNIGKKIIKRRIAVLRQYGAPVAASDGYDLRKISEWTPQRFAAVTRMEKRLFDYFDSMPITGFRQVFPRSKRTRQALRETFSGKERPSWFRGELIPDFGDGKIKYHVNKYGEVIYSNDNKETITIIMEPKFLLSDPEGYISYITDKLRDRGASVFVIKAGQHYFRPGIHNGGMYIDPSQGWETVQALQERYDNTDEWLTRIEGWILPHEEPFDDLDDYEQYERSMSDGFTVARKLRNYNEIRQQIKKKRKSQYRRFRRWERQGKL